MDFDNNTSYWIGKCSAELNRIEKLQDICLKTFAQSVRYVNFDGEVHEAEEVNDRWHELYLKGVKEEAVKFVGLLFNKNDAKIKELEMTRSDKKSYSKWRKAKEDPYSRTDNLPIYYGLTKRAMKLAKWQKEDILNVFEERIQSYRLLAPHTYCFSPEFPANLKNRMADRFLRDLESYEVSGGWIRSLPLKMVETDGHKVSFVIYAASDNRLKLKMYSTHRKLDLEDVLDVEVQFKGGKFEDIVHYHVKKPFTLIALADDNSDLIFPDYFEMSGNPRTGRVRMTEGGIFVDEKKTTTEIPEARRSIIAMRYWGENPIIAGGELLDKAIKIIEGEGKYEALVGLARKMIKD